MCGLMYNLEDLLKTLNYVFFKRVDFMWIILQEIYYFLSVKFQ